MAFSMYPGTGMGASGMGTGNVGNLTPQQLAMLLKQLMGGGAAGGAPGGGPTGTPMPSAAPPMPQMPGGAPQMGAPPPPPTPLPIQQAPNQFPSLQSIASATAPGGAMPGMPPGQPQSIAGADQNAQIAKLLASLARQGQSGVSPAGATGGSGLMSFIANLLQGRQGNGMPGGGMMDQLQQQAAGNIASGAPGL